jgi:hypothetical protein
MDYDTLLKKWLKRTRVAQISHYKSAVELDTVIGGSGFWPWPKPSWLSCVLNAFRRPEPFGVRLAAGIVSMGGSSDRVNSSTGPATV